MTAAADRRPAIRFEAFELDRGVSQLRKNGHKVRLQEQPYRVLAMLLERPGEIVTREEMRQSLWPADTFVDFDHGLNSAVARLREALDDSAEQPKFIETVPRQGYRFVGLIDSPAPPPHATAEPTRSQLTPNRMRWIVSIAALVVMALGSAWLLRAHFEPPLPSLELTPLVGMPGFEIDPAFAPDGSQVAFVEFEGKNSGIYTALVGSEKPLRLTYSINDCCPAWSPDQRQLAFIRFSVDDAGIYVIPALGGNERHLYTLPPPAYPGLDWSPDGRFLAFSENARSNLDSRITLLSLADSSRRQITLPPPGSRDYAPVFSPDGSQVAFIRATIAGVVNDVFIVPVSGGETRRITFDECPNFGISWSEDGREIIYSSRRGGVESLWRVSASGGTPQPVAGAGSPAKNPSIAHKGNVLAYQQVIGKDDIARISLADPQHAQGLPAVIISEKGSKIRPRFSPDGTRIAFESDRLGSAEIWICDSNGGNCAQLTSLHGTAGTAAWSPDGHYLAFEFHPGERAEIYVVELPSGVPHLVTTVPGADNLAPSWSRDGKWIYFASKRNGAPFQVWKAPFKDGSPVQVSPVQVTKNSGVGAIESPDGRFIYYTKYEQGGLWRMPSSGGPETRVLDELEGYCWPDWALSDKGIYFLQQTNVVAATMLNFFDFSTNKVVRIASFDKPVGWGISLSPDGKSLIYVETEFAESNVMLVKNFR